MKNSPKKIKKCLNDVISQVAAHPELYTAIPHKNFTRTRKLPFSKMLFSILALESKDLKCEILDSFDFSSNVPSVSAFVQQRNKISFCAFEDIFRQFTASAASNSLYKGYRLVAADGSDLHVPTNKNEISSFYPSKNNVPAYNILHLNALYDLKTNLYLDATVFPSKAGDERSAFNQMIDRDTSCVPTIYIADRGFESYNTIAHVKEKKQFFLFRIQDSKQNGIAKGLSLPDTEEFDVPLHLKLTRRSASCVKNDPTLKCIANSTRLDFLPPYSNKEDSFLSYPMDFRVVRFQISENIFETLITNLPSGEFPPDELKKLYALRWGIETSFRSLKYTLGLLYFHSKKTESICQEIFAKLTMYNFAELIISQIVIKQKCRKYAYKANFSAAVHICFQFLSKKLSPSVVEALIKKHLVPIKPSSTNPRRMSVKPNFHFLYRVA